MNRLIAVLCLLGAGIAGYLTWGHFAELEPFCVGGGGACERVQSSRYAELLGVPVAVIGLAGYAAVLGSLALDRAVTALLALVGAGFSAYLTYIELAIIHAICQWCVASAAVMTAIAVVAMLHLARDDLRQNPDGEGHGAGHTERTMAIPTTYKR
jgi:uncharacterized membrane protein